MSDKPCPPLSSTSANANGPPAELLQPTLSKKATIIRLALVLLHQVTFGQAKADLHGRHGFMTYCLSKHPNPNYHFKVTPRCYTTSGVPYMDLHAQSPDACVTQAGIDDVSQALGIALKHKAFHACAWLYAPEQLVCLFVALCSWVNGVYTETYNELDLCGHERHCVKQLEQLTCRAMWATACGSMRAFYDALATTIMHEQDRASNSTSFMDEDGVEIEGERHEQRKREVLKLLRKAQEDIASQQRQYSSLCAGFTLCLSKWLRGQNLPLEKTVCLLQSMTKGSLLSPVLLPAETPMSGQVRDEAAMAQLLTYLSLYTRYSQFGNGFALLASLYFTKNGVRMRTWGVSSASVYVPSACKHLPPEGPVVMCHMSPDCGRFVKEDRGMRMFCRRDIITVRIYAFDEAMVNRCNASGGCRGWSCSCCAHTAFAFFNCARSLSETTVGNDRRKALHVSVTFANRPCAASDSVGAHADFATPPRAGPLSRPPSVGRRTAAAVPIKPMADFVRRRLEFVEAIRRRAARDMTQAYEGNTEETKQKSGAEPRGALAYTLVSFCDQHTPSVPTTHFFGKASPSLRRRDWQRISKQLLHEVSRQHTQWATAPGPALQVPACRIAQMWAVCLCLGTLRSPDTALVPGEAVLPKGQECKAVGGLAGEYAHVLASWLRDDATENNICQIQYRPMRTGMCTDSMPNDTVAFGVLGTRQALCCVATLEKGAVECATPQATKCQPHSASPPCVFKPEFLATIERAARAFATPSADLCLPLTGRPNRSAAAGRDATAFPAHCVLSHPADALWPCASCDHGWFVRGSSAFCCVCGAHAADDWPFCQRPHQDSGYVVGLPLRGHPDANPQSTVFDLRSMRGSAKTILKPEQGGTRYVALVTDQKYLRLLATLRDASTKSCPVLAPVYDLFEAQMTGTSVVVTPSAVEVQTSSNKGITDWRYGHRHGRSSARLPEECRQEWHATSSSAAQEESSQNGASPPTPMHETVLSLAHGTSHWGMACGNKSDCVRAMCRFFVQNYDDFERSPSHTTANKRPCDVRTPPQSPRVKRAKAEAAASRDLSSMLRRPRFLRSDEIPHTDLTPVSWEEAAGMVGLAYVCLFATTTSDLELPHGHYLVRLRKPAASGQPNFQDARARAAAAFKTAVHVLQPQTDANILSQRSLPLTQGQKQALVSMLLPCPPRSEPPSQIGEHRTPRVFGRKWMDATIGPFNIDYTAPVYIVDAE